VLPATRVKNGKAHVVHLAEPVHAIIQELPKVTGNPHVFAGKRGKAVAAFGYAKGQVEARLAEAGTPIVDWRFHDFRRAGVTALAGMGFPPHVCDRLLNHVTGSISGVAAVYQRAEFLAERKAALDAWARLIVSAAEAGPTESNVVPLYAVG
jgi:integrase